MSSERFCLRLVRVLQLKAFLDRRKALPRYEELAERFNVCTRTMRRDVQALRDAGVHVPEAVDSWVADGVSCNRYTPVEQRRIG